MFTTNYKLIKYGLRMDFPSVCYNAFVEMFFYFCLLFEVSGKRGNFPRKKPCIGYYL